MMLPGRLDYACNNACIEIEQGRLAEGSEAEFDAIMGVNVKGVWRWGFWGSP